MCHAAHVRVQGGTCVMHMPVYKRGVGGHMCHTAMPWPEAVLTSDSISEFSKSGEEGCSHCLPHPHPKSWHPEVGVGVTGKRTLVRQAPRGLSLVVRAPVLGNQKLPLGPPRCSLQGTVWGGGQDAGT